MYGSKVGPAAATGLGAGAGTSYLFGGWLWAAVAAVLIVGTMLVVRPWVMHRRHAALGMVGGNTSSWRKRMHMRRRR